MSATTKELGILIAIELGFIMRSEGVMPLICFTIIPVRNTHIKLFLDGFEHKRITRIVDNKCHYSTIRENIKFRMDND
jgi:hypothetical protein